MTTSPIPHQRSIRNLGRSGNGMMDQPQNQGYQSQHPQQHQGYQPQHPQHPQHRQPQQIQGRGQRTPVGVHYNTPQPYQRQESFNLPSYQPYPSHPSQMVPQQQYPSVHPTMYEQNIQNYQQRPMGYPQPIQQLPMVGAQGQNCRLISEHVKNCPYCNKIYKRDSNLLITVIVILLLFIVVLLTKLADK